MSTAAEGEATPMSPAELNQRALWQHAIDQHNAAYAAALDDRRFDEWPGFFVEDGLYQLQSRENFDRGLPLALLSLEGQGMMRDRIYGTTQTIYHAPYYTRHVLAPAMLGAEGLHNGVLSTVTHYAVFRTKPGSVSEVYNVGRYIDDWVPVGPDTWRLLRRLCVYDSELVLNSLIYPI